jgi:hypothetical protein
LEGSVIDMSTFTKVGETDRGSSPLFRETELINLFIVTATLRRRSSGGMSVIVQWATSDERFVIQPKGEMTYPDGAQIEVLLSTVVSSRRGCYNGHAAVEAIRTAPGVWSQNNA